MSRLTELFGIDVPIVLGPFGGLSSIELTSAVSAGGGLGSFGLYGYTPDRIAETIRGLRAATDRPVAVNLWWPRGDEVTPGDVDLEPVLDATASLFEAAGAPRPTPPPTFLPDIAEQLDAVFAGGIDVLSVVYGVPDAATVARAREHGIRLVGTATSVAEAIALEAAGVDAIVATGMEAAGP
ncbi:NAD(P)H-dependent flavin oxidoreductase [Microbacterium sp. 1P10AE]|uniref:NAD(P)H-dependent flavin oxidoreductase n=1 Tax=Microbacterium sp. 1P10AE TaxID=3132286 RepID=UPI0039A27505